MFRIGLFIIKGLCIAFFVILNLFEDLPLKPIKGLVDSVRQPADEITMLIGFAKLSIRQKYHCWKM